ncbi:UNVERIFIED_CONTAM: hypothetical protein Sangu_1698300 [Sesamum angustifolium]|uniref:Uncharacterized protein n=1 Tax=Sesamum angustifolium TaxID=2727405 RepID=A0AAW2ML46_9LAMI
MGAVGGGLVGQILCEGGAVADFPRVRMGTPARVRHLDCYSVEMLWASARGIEFVHRLGGAASQRDHGRWMGERSGVLWVST